LRTTATRAKTIKPGRLATLLAVLFYSLLFHATLAAALDADQQLFEAIEQRDIAAVNQAIQDQANVNAQQSKLLSKETPLFLAVSLDEIEIVELLIELGAKIDDPQQELSRRTPLSAAISQGSLEMVSLLIAQGANVNKQTGLGGNHSPLYLATKNGNLPAVQQLLDAGAKIIPGRWSHFKEILAAPWNLLRGKVVGLNRPPSLLEAAEASGNDELYRLLKSKGAR